MRKRYLILALTACLEQRETASASMSVLQSGFVTSWRSLHEKGRLKKDYEK